MSTPRSRLAKENGGRRDDPLMEFAQEPDAETERPDWTPSHQKTSAWLLLPQVPQQRLCL